MATPAPMYRTVCKLCGVTLQQAPFVPIVGTIDATASPVDEDGWSAPSGPDREEAQV